MKRISLTGFRQNFLFRVLFSDSSTMFVDADCSSSAIIAAFRWKVKWGELTVTPVSAVLL